MIGIDEVGRGALAGPLLVCAVRLNKPLDGLKDSKLLSANKRLALSIIIRQNADVGYGWINAATIDDIGLSESLKLASAKAIQDINPLSNEIIIIDGLINFLPDLNCKCLAKADNLYAQVSAASIIAKVTRDQYMQKLAKKYPGYGLEFHVGYGTKMHLESINKLGFTLEHRKSFNIDRHLNK
ncbi:MAG: ribonuclease HII [Candidatus Saccharibacteria bacterium]